ncbi:MAG TPA: carboxypeptidase regulatory-like domain-containing protein, partial [Longimicrobiales bacterium]|nr:carboxypeptidase regulatory-like domain-containing protein [Longimicrobiales bacterium]
MRTAIAGRATARALALLGAGVAPLVPPGLAAQEPPDTVLRSPAEVVGAVVDVESGAPVDGASVTLSPLAGGRDVSPVLADSTGTFAFPALEAGRYRIHIVRIGYRALVDTIALAGNSEIRVRASMVPAALDLEPLVVTAVRRTPAFMREFERRRRRGFGSFITREEIEEQMPFATSDLFRRLPGMRVVPRGATGGPGLVMRGRCRPQLYIDGIPAWNEVSIDLALHPDDIEAIEVYST